MSGHQISVDLKSTIRIPVGRGFYDNYEGVLNFAVKARGKFHSYIQSDNLSIDISKSGGLLNIEVVVPKEKWEEEKNLKPPSDAPLGRIKFLDFRLNINGESYLTNEARDLLYIRFSKENHIETYEIAENLYVDVNVVSELAGLWLLNVVDDYGFKNEMAFRRSKQPSRPE